MRSFVVIVVALAVVCALSVDAVRLGDGANPRGAGPYCGNCERVATCLVNVYNQNPWSCGTGAYTTAVQNACNDCGGSWNGNGCTPAWGAAGCDAAGAPPSGSYCGNVVAC